jgi:outer membrane beta-barrel protein
MKLARFFLTLLLLSKTALAADPAPAPAAAPAQKVASNDAAGERVNVDQIKEKYWARGDESELGVVQNRLYSEEKKLDFSLFGGTMMSDPFLSVRSMGAELGYHFSEYLALSFMGWKSYASPSSALLTFQDTIGATTNVNPPLGFYGSEVAAQVLYGKLSLFGAAIIYYDFHLNAGAGITSTQSGNDFTPFAGIGQKTFLAKNIALTIDYRLMRYTETIIEQVITPKLGQPVGERANWTNAVTLGVSFLFGVVK